MSYGNDQDFDSGVTRRGQHAGTRPSGLQPTRTQGERAARPAVPASGAASEIGLAVGDNVHELVVSCDAVPALLQQFDHVQPEFVAVHDIGAASSRKLLAGVAQACGLRLKQLVIRRQGYGNTLATLEFLEFAGAEGGTLRVYSTDAEADEPARVGLARALLAHSRLGVLMVNDLRPQALATAFKPLRDAIISGPWPNRDLLLLPLASSAALASQGSDLGRGTGVTVRTTPAAQRPSDAWAFVSGAWSRLRTQMAATGKFVPLLVTPPLRPAASSMSSPTAVLPGSAAGLAARPASPALEPMLLRPMAAATVAPSAAAAAPAAATKTSEAAASAPLARYVEQVCKLNGVLACCVFEAASGRSFAQASDTEDATVLAAAGAALLAAITRAGHRLGLEASPPEAAITLATRHLILRAVPRHPDLMLHAVLDKELANLTLARLQIQRLDELFDDAPA
jgi:hypothetical protein